MAQAYQALGKTELALACLQISVSVWQHPDSDYAKALDANALLKQLQSNS